MITNWKAPSALGKAATRSAHALLVALALVACSDSTGPRDTGPSLRIEPLEASVFEGDTVRLTARVFDQAGIEVADAPVAWEVADTTLAAFVDPDVLVLLRPGTLRITARSGSAADTYDLVIGGLIVQRVDVTPNTIGMGRTDHLVITARAVGQGGRQITDRPVTFMSDDTLVAIAVGLASSDDPSSALVIAVGAGSTTIRATADGVTGTATVGVVALDTTFSLTQYSGSPLPVLVETDTIVADADTLVYEVYADQGTLVLSGLLQRRYELDQTYGVYRVIRMADPAEREFVVRIRGEHDRGVVVSARPNGSLSMVSEIIGPHLEHTATHWADGYLVRYRIPGEDEQLDLGYSRAGSP